MSTCRWCTPGGQEATCFLKRYASGTLSTEEKEAANEDLSFCFECVVEYHRARDQLPSFHKILWKLETFRLISHLEKAMKGEPNQDDLYIVEDHQEIQISNVTGSDLENNLRIPLLEIMKYPYLLLHLQIGDLCVEAFHKIESDHSFQVFEKHAAIYLLLVHPDEIIRKWAIRTARSLGKVDRDDFYDLQDVVSCMFKVIELDLFVNSDIYNSEGMEEGKLILLPPHLYEANNYKNYWLGICMLLTVLDAQAMDTLLLGPDRQSNLMQSILNTMEKRPEDDDQDPFWPALQCFMVILDRLGSKVWAMLIDPNATFQTIIRSPSYNKEVEHLRRNTSGPRVKVEPEADDDMVTCSQIVYDCNTNKQSKDAANRHPMGIENCIVMYEEMQSLVNVLQSDIGQDIRIHDSTFLWFFPFVRSVMDLNSLSVVYVGEIIHHLHTEIKDLLNGRLQHCDKVTEFFVLILVFVVELHRSKNCMNLLWYTSHCWIEVLVKCATVCSPAFSQPTDSSSRVSSTTSVHPQVIGVVPQACIQLIRSLLRDGCQLYPELSCKQYLDMLNRQMRKGFNQGWNLSSAQLQDLQSCLMSLVKNMRNLVPSVKNVSPPEEPTLNSKHENARRESEQRHFECRDEQHGTPSDQQCGVHLKKEPPWDEGFCVRSCHEQTRPAKQNEKSCGLAGKAFNKDEESVSDSHTSVQDRLHYLKSKLNSADLLSKLSKVISPSQIKKERVEDCSVSEKRASSHDNTKEQKEKSLVGETSAVPRSIKQEPKWPTSRQQPFGDDGERRSSSDDDVPLTVLKSSLRKKAAVATDVQDTLTPSQVDKDLGFLSLAALTKSFNFPDTSSQESSMQCPNRVERKVKRMKKKLEADNIAVVEVSTVKDPVIVISDSSDEDACLSENEPEANREEVSEPSHGRAAEKTSEENLGLNSPVSLECDSQCFEHETQDDIYSAWEKDDGNLKDSSGTGAPSPVPVEMYDNWGYDTDYVPDDQIEMVAAEAEEQLRCAEGLNQNTSSASSVSVAITKKTEAKVSPLGESTHQRKLCGVKSAGVEEAAAATCATDGYKKAQTLVQPEKTAKSTTCLSAEKSKATKASPQSIEKNVPSTSHLLEKMPPTASASAVVPTETVRPQEDLCIAERLCLKKKPRQGEVSQNSLSSIEELRRQGRDVQLDNRSRRIRKSKGNHSLRPQKSVGKGISKMNPQYLQFLLQCRPKDLQKTSKMPPSAPAPPKQAIPCQSNSFFGKVSDVASPKLPPPKKAEPMSNDMKKAAYKDIDFFPLSQLGPDSEDEDDNMKQAGTSAADNPEQGVNCDQSLHPSLAREKDQPGVENSKAENEDDDDDEWNLTQPDPIDMEMCSQVETSDDFGLDQNVPVGQGSVGDLYGLRPSIKPANNQPAAVQTEGLAAPKPLVEAKKDEHVFLVPGMPISEQKALKPSTTKIYASTSRSATLAQELEKPTKTASIKKIVRPLLPSRSTALPAPARPPPVNGQEREMISNVSHRVNIPPNPVLSIPRPVMHQNPDTLKATSLLPANLDPKFFIQEILKWSYEMFDNFPQFGAPDNLCKFPLKEVPDRFQSFEEYFCTFYPLLMMNTFEEMVQEWLRNSKPNKAYETTLTIKTVECPYRYYSGTFTATLHNSQVQRQLYPKEDDMVFLWLPQYLNPYTNDEREVESVPYVGYVSKSAVVTGQNDRSAILHVTIETSGNISVINNQPVKCKVIGSLVSAGRVFKALYSLRNGFMTKLLLTPQVTYFKPTSQEPTSDWNFEDFNGEQIKAINSAFSMTRQPVRTPKICLIHGPPGTGKTKTIVGLLQLIFFKVHRNENFIQNQRLKSKRPRVLLCAPSNAAVDHLMKKVILCFKNKCKDERRLPLGNCGDINLVRLGMEKSIMKDLTAFSLDNQTKARIERTNSEQDRIIDRHIQDLDARLENLSHMCAQFKKDHAKYQVLMDEKLQLLKDRERLGRQQKQTRIRKQEAQTRILQDAHVICCTLSTSGSILLEVAFRRLGQDPFTCVIVDEAGQATETETLIPLTYRSATLVLVGDPEQLPPTVVSKKAKERKYDQSLMARLWKCLHRDIKQNLGIQNPINFLTMQYRMHPDICLFPSNYIYNRALKTDGDTAAQRCSIRWPFQPYCIFDVVDGRETREGDSFVNHQEVKLVMELIKLVVEKQKGRVGVITHYSAQKNRIREILNKEKKKDPMKLLQCVEVDTVDGFQGQEKDCIIVSCVRASSSKGSIGFVGNKQRLNVTLTRAKQSLFILGHLKTLMDHRDWGALIQDAYKRGNIIKTQDKDYKKDALWIFKPEPALTRSLSYPPADSSRSQPKPQGSSPAQTSSNQGLMPPASSHSAAPISAAVTVERRHTTETLTAVGTQVLKSCLALSSVRPTVLKETSKDPRLASRQRDATKNQLSTEKGPAAANRMQSSSTPGKTLPVPVRGDGGAPPVRERPPRWDDQARPQKRPLDSREYDVSHKRQK
ncbi:probable helicase senataxin [Erpetoichthys calabaricus]|uniref:Senataxin n=1 Tax=Erpetoichthys calabaricus TaxID=27687 RepID=A0A8C4XHA7_ERPCA|nr:probable helicase senataxin [Erpetoichthys calabaricus]